jgi:hypothetical protein
MADLTSEVQRQREIIDGILPAYVRIRETVDRLQSEVTQLRRKVKEHDRSLERKKDIMGIFNDRYHALRDYVYRNVDEDAEVSNEAFVRPEDYGPADIAQGDGVPMDLGAETETPKVYRSVEAGTMDDRPDIATPVEGRPVEHMPYMVRPIDLKPEEVLADEDNHDRPMQVTAVEGPNDTLMDDSREVSIVPEELTSDITAGNSVVGCPDVTGISASPPAEPVPTVSHTASNRNEDN